jgi:hypothetical protein
MPITRVLESAFIIPKTENPIWNQNGERAMIRPVGGRRSMVAIYKVNPADKHDTGYKQYPSIEKLEEEFELKHRFQIEGN